MKVAYRQGDVTLIKIPRADGQNSTDFQKKPNKKGQTVLAEGEVTGHAHVMDKDVTKLFTGDGLPTGHSILVVTETTVAEGSFIEGKVIETMKDGTIRFKQSDGVIMRFLPTDITVKGDTGVIVNRAYSPLTHDEHDGIPVGKGTYRVIQHQTVTATRRRAIVND